MIDFILKLIKLLELIYYNVLIYFPEVFCPNRIPIKTLSAHACHTFIEIILPKTKFHNSFTGKAKTNPTIPLINTTKAIV